MSGHKLLLNQVPSKLFDAFGIILVYEFLPFILVIIQHYAFQQGIRIGQFPHFLLTIVANILQELIIAVDSKLCLQPFNYLCTEFGLTLYSTFTEYIVEEFLIYIVLFIMTDFRYLIAEIAFIVFHVIAVNLQ